MNSAGKAPIILMAEDDSDDCLLAQDALKDSGVNCDLRFVSDGVELMDYLFQRNKYCFNDSAPRPALVMLDLNMPRKDGREALQEMKADASLRKIPVIVLTTSTADPDIARMYELGANSYISKPVAFAALVEVMKTIGHYWFQVVVLPKRG